MTGIIGLLRHKLVVRAAGLAALCVLIWFVGPRITVARMAPLASALNRLLAILIVIVLWTLHQFIQRRRSQKKEQQLMADLASPRGDAAQADVEQAQAKEIADLSRKFEQALQLLKTARSKGWRDKQYLYELPWYVIIGAPGCGKTTLLANSGLRFPLAGKVDRDDIQGVGGTRNCDWLFTDEAIFLDTAGRYTTQDSHQQVDAAAWRGFLDLIKKYRPRRPINGVLVTASLLDLLQQTEEQIERQSVHVRQRISELAKVLGIRFPVYMIFTKCDLVAGFNDLFGRLDADQRAQVWGETFMLSNARQPQDHIDGYLAQFEDSLRRLIHWAYGRIQEERDIRRRSLILSFPRQMALLKPKIRRFLLQTFSSSPYDKFIPLLRGVYLTSGTQEGTPIDRVMGMLASTYGLDRQQAPIFSGQGKSYFITRLLKAVIFPEAQLAGVDPRVERRRRLMQMAAYCSVLILTVGMIALWSTSYVRNKRAIGLIRDRIEQYNRLTDDNSRWDTAVKSLLMRLNSVSAANAVYEHPGPGMGFGLGQGDKIQAGIGRLYRQLLEDRFLPLIKARLEQRLQASLHQGTEEDTAVLYELLRTYLMLGQPQKRLDPPLAARRIGNDWKHNFAREPELHGHLDRHIQNLLVLPLAPIQLNETLIVEARRILNTQPLSAQVFAHLQAEALSDHRHDFRLADVLGPHSQTVFTTADGRKLETLMIPGLYTHDGYHAFFVKKGLRYIQQALEENWVLDNYAAEQESDLPRLYDDLQRIYFDQYEKQWRRLLQNLKVRKAGGISQEIQILDILSGPETPLRPLMASVEKNTTLYGPSKREPAHSGGEEEQAAGTMSALADQALRKEAVPRHALELEKKFKDIHYLVRSKDGASPPLDHLLESANSIRNFMMQIDSAGDSDENALQKALERMNGGGGMQIKAAQMDFARQPEPVNSWFSSLTTSSLEFTLASAKSELNAMWKAEVLVPYEACLQGRYPIYPKSAYDVTIEDFSRFFKPAGTIDSFFQKHLRPFVDKTHTRWRPKKIENLGMQLSLTTLRQLQNAAAIRDAFFAGGGSYPSLSFALVPVDLDENVAVFTIDIEGQAAEYSHGPTRAQQFVWPGPDAGAGVRMTFETIDGQRISHLEKGAWAWLKTLDKATAESMGQRDRIMLTFHLGNCTARYELRASSVYHPFQLQALRNFRCPESF